MLVFVKSAPFFSTVKNGSALAFSFIFLVATAGKSGLFAQTWNPPANGSTANAAANASTITPNRVEPRSIPNNRIGPNLMENNRIPSNRIPANSREVGNASQNPQTTPDPNAGLPIRPGALVNPRYADQPLNPQYPAPHSAPHFADGSAAMGQNPALRTSGPIAQAGSGRIGGSIQPVSGTTPAPAAANPQNPVAPQNPAAPQNPQFPSYITEEVPNIGTPGAPNLGNRTAPGISTSGPQPLNQPNNPQPPRPQQTGPKGGQPFPPLTEEEQAVLDKFLSMWELQSGKIERFETKFHCYKYGSLLMESKGNASDPDFTTFGWIRYITPNKGVYEIEGEVVLQKDASGKVTDAKELKDRRREKFLSTGTSIYGYDFDGKVQTEYRIPPEDQKDVISGGGPMPFVFGAKADDLKKRYYLRINTPPVRRESEIWLEAWPRWQEDSDEFKYVQIIVDARLLIPAGFIKYDVNGKERTSYVFDRNTMKINSRVSQIAGVFTGHFRPDLPQGWTKTVEEYPSKRLTAQQTPGTVNPTVPNMPNRTLPNRPIGGPPPTEQPIPPPQPNEIPLYQADPRPVF